MKEKAKPRTVMAFGEIPMLFIFLASGSIKV
jgi:hypothetical protein